MAHLSTLIFLHSILHGPISLPLARDFEWFRVQDLGGTQTAVVEPPLSLRTKQKTTNSSDYSGL